MRFPDTVNLNLTYRVSDLLEILQRNLEKHLEAHAEALGIYQAKAHQYLDSAAAAAGRGDKPDRNPLKDIPEPISYAEHYERAIQMLEMTTEKEIQLDYQLFLQLVRDEWWWSGEFAQTVTSYLGG